MKKILFSLLLFQSAILIAQPVSSGKNIEYTFPDSSWEYLKDPSTQGWNNEKLAALKQFIIDSANTTGMMVIQKGKVIFSYGDVKELCYIASGRKSVLAMLYGPFVESGKINLNETLEQLNIDDLHGLLPLEKKATILNLLTARSGVYHEASYPGTDVALAPGRGTVIPGSLFLYNNWDFNLAGYLFERLSGVDIYNAVDSMLAKPLKMQDWDKSIQHKEGDSTKSIYPAYPMWFSTRDMARIGYLMLHNGKWKNQQIISRDWVHTITTPVTSFKEQANYRASYYPYENFGYGYLWWIWDTPNDTGAYKNAYTAWGNYGQYITILPVLDVVVAHKTKDVYERKTEVENYFQILNKLITANDSFARKKNWKNLIFKKEIVNRYTGDYEFENSTSIVKVFLENDTMRITTTSPWENSKESVFAISDTAFIGESNTIFSFTNLKTGKTANLFINSNGKIITANRIYFVPSNKYLLSEFIGEYYNKELQVNYTIQIKDRKLVIINSAISDTILLNEIGKDIFKYKTQNFHFKRSVTSKKIMGFSVETRGLPGMQFFKK